MSLACPRNDFETAGAACGGAVEKVSGIAGSDIRFLRIVQSPMNDVRLEGLKLEV
jgi:hypothetical protein